MVFPIINLSVLVLCLVFHFSFSSPVVNPGSCLGSRAMADIVSVDSNAEGSRLPYFSLLRSYQRNVPPPILLVWRYALSTLGLCLKGRRSYLLPLRRLCSAHEWFGFSAPTTFMPRLTLFVMGTCSSVSRRLQSGRSGHEVFTRFTRQPSAPHQSWAKWISLCD